MFNMGKEAIHTFIIKCKTLVLIVLPSEFKLDPFLAEFLIPRKCKCLGNKKSPT